MLIFLLSIIHPHFSFLIKIHVLLNNSIWCPWKWSNNDSSYHWSMFSLSPLVIITTNQQIPWHLYKTYLLEIFVSLDLAKIIYGIELVLYWITVRIDWKRNRIITKSMLCLDDSVLIVFIDYGNSESKPPNEIYPLTETLARLPAMTVACTLHEVRFHCWIILVFFSSFILLGFS